MSIEKALLEAVLRTADYEATFYEGQSPVEDWVIHAIEHYVSGDTDTASALLERYSEAPWGHWDECDDLADHDADDDRHRSTWACPAGTDAPWAHQVTFRVTMRDAWPSR